MESFIFLFLFTFSRLEYLWKEAERTGRAVVVQAGLRGELYLSVVTFGNVTLFSCLFHN